MHCAPGSSTRLGALQQVATMLTRVNELWIMSELELGAVPPISCREVRAPYGAPIKWRNYHGAPVGVARHYYVAPSLWELAAATCMDIVCYDAARMRVDGVDAWPVVRETANVGQYHVWLRVPTGPTTTTTFDHVSRNYGG